MLRALGDVTYLPILSVRPGEMRALEELPNRTKDRMLPYVPLRPWVGAHRLASALNRIEEAYADRALIIGVGDREPYKPRPVFDELDELRNPNAGFRNWIHFLRDHENFIPAAQLFAGEIEDENAQIEELANLDRGIVLHVPRDAFGGLELLAQRVSAHFPDGENALFILDFGTVRVDHLQVGMISVGLIQTIRQACPRAYCAISATSFPSAFDGLNDQPIYERRLFEVIEEQAARLIYSDRGSARIDQPGGGGGQPYPRIDYSLARDWRFYRSNVQNGFLGYQQQALELSRTDFWNPDIRVWGTQMIERTIAGDRSAISDPRKATAARINLHLQVQTFFEDPEEAEETEEDWED